MELNGTKRRMNVTKHGSKHVIITILNTEKLIKHAEKNAMITILNSEKPVRYVAMHAIKNVIITILNSEKLRKHICGNVIVVLVNLNELKIMSSLKQITSKAGIFIIDLSLRWTANSLLRMNS